MKSCLYAVLLAITWQTFAFGEVSRSLSLRREYNQVLASLDTLARRYDQGDIERLVRLPSRDGLLPAGFDLVLIFWADDEAELFVNGFKVGQTRLTPTMIDIPEIYLRDQNRLEAHCWDTDRVESGFMAGLYLREQGGGLRRVTATGDGTWRAGERSAETIYYSHAQPDIADAHVIWSEQLFGEVVLSVEFGTQSLKRAVSRRLQHPPERVENRSMEMHDLVAKITALERRRQELARLLDDLHTTSYAEVNYSGFADSRLAFTLGRAAPLMDRESAKGGESLLDWVDTLPAEKQQVVMWRGRQLRGRSVATPSAARQAAATGPEDRRREYTPPTDRGGLLADTGGGSAQVGRSDPVGRSRFPWSVFAATVLMAAYLGLGGRQWCRLYGAKEWIG